MSTNESIEFYARQLSYSLGEAQLAEIHRVMERLAAEVARQTAMAIVRQAWKVGADEALCRAERELI